MDCNDYPFIIRKPLMPLNEQGYQLKPPFY